MLHFTAPEILYLFGAFHGVFLALLLLRRKGAMRANIFLSLLIFLFSFYLIENVIYSSGYLRQLPHFFFATIPLTFLIGPLFYCYIRSNVLPDFRLTIKDGFLIFPFLIEVLILLPFYTLSADIKIKIYEATLQPRPGRLDNLYFLGYLIYIATTCWCFIQAFRIVSDTNPITNQKARSKRRWLKNACLTFSIYLVLSMVLTIVATFVPTLMPVSFHANLIIQLLLIHAIGYVAFIYPDWFEMAASKKYQSSSLNAEAISHLKIQLMELIDTAKPYLNSEVDPDYFVEKLGIPKHHLSQVLTEGMHTTFYDLINSYRIETAKALLSSASYENAKVIHVAFDCGFSNKSSFLRNFKKLTGTTPTEFRESLFNQVPRN
jgi:AraC-like DNA-binding protein